MDAFDSLNVETFFGLDIVFVIDSTGSMLSYINGAKESIKEIMNQSKIRFQKCKADQSLLKFGIVSFRDHPPQDNSYVTKIENFTSYIEATTFLDTLSASGGGDPPEAVLDGLNDAIFKLSWREESEKMLFLLLDNPGHGLRFGTSYDCPCGYHEKDILPVMRGKNIAFHVIRPKEENIKLDKMLSLFQDYIHIDTLELEKHKKMLLSSDRVMDEKMEFKIFNRARISSFKRNSRSSFSEKKSSRSSSAKRKVAKDISRERSRSISGDRKKSMEIEYCDTVDHFKPKSKFEKTKPEVFVDYIEMNIEMGIKDHISKVVIERLTKYLKLDD
jgi:hypothetical protein